MSHGTTTVDGRSRFGLVATCIAILLGASLGYRVLGLSNLHFADEGFHAPQVWAFFVGRLEILQSTTMLPTYHAVLALVERLVGLHDNRLLRLVNLLGGLALPALVWQLVSLHAPAEAGRRAVQWFFMPLLFPFWFLIYTDTWALVAVLATMLLALRRHYVSAGIAALGAILLRQDMIVWVGLAWLLVALDGAPAKPWRAYWREHWASVLARGGPLLAVMTLFVAFYLWNGGVAVGDRQQHTITLNLTNVAYFLLCAWVVFLPQNLHALPRIKDVLRRPVTLALLAAGFVLYMACYANKHPYNQADLRFYLHNEGLHWLTKSTWFRIVAFVPMAWMVLTLCVTRLADPRLYWMYLVAPLSVALHPLIEQRYYLPALTLFQVWRPGAGDRAENAALLIYLLMTPLIVWGIATRRFFP